MTELIVTSFFTTDAYYSTAADKLRDDLDRLGVEHELRPIEKGPDDDWADICRKKVPFLHELCKEHPDRRIVWIDVDCRLISIPVAVRQSSADIVGFGRGFSSALKIGYKNRSRFWEPCFWGVGTSPAARKMIADAAALEARSELKATDDYFFEEAWRANADRLTFQVLPSSMALGRGQESGEAFLIFGSSGSVDEFRGKVAQHAKAGTAQRSNWRAKTLEAVKSTVLQAPDPVVLRAMEIGQRTGVTEFLKRGSMSPQAVTRNSSINSVLQAGIDGRPDDLERHAAALSEFLLSEKELATIEAGRAFASYRAKTVIDTAMPLKWWARPFPGNFGDWLSPYLIRSLLDQSVRYVPPTSRVTTPHLMLVGSIGRYANAGSILIGTGVSRESTELDSDARYLSVRGPLTAKILQSQGGPTVDVFGDPGILIDRAYPLSREATNGRLALVRHFTHGGLPVMVGDDVDELSVLRGGPQQLEAFLEQLVQYDGVVTSAMHVLIACHAYGIPCTLVTFEGFEDAVHGDGMKYTDYALGAGIEPVERRAIPLDLTHVNLRSLLERRYIAEEVKDVVSQTLAAGVDLLAARR